MPVNPPDVESIWKARKVKPLSVPGNGVDHWRKIIVLSCLSVIEDCSWDVWTVCHAMTPRCIITLRNAHAATIPRLDHSENRCQTWFCSSLLSHAGVPPRRKVCVEGQNGKSSVVPGDGCTDQSSAGSNLLGCQSFSR